MSCLSTTSSQFQSTSRSAMAVTKLSLLFSLVVVHYHPAATIVSKVVVGGILQQDFDVLLYETSIPLAFRVWLPTVDAHLSSLRTCNASQNLCHLHTDTLAMAKLINTHLTGDNPYVKKPSAQYKQGRNRGRSEKIFGIATQSQITELHTTQEHMERWIDKIETSFVSDHNRLVNVTTELTSYSVNLRAYMLGSTKNFTDTLKKIRESEMTNEHVLASTIHNLAVSVYNSDVATSMLIAAAECRSGLISPTLLSGNVLDSRLTNLTFELNKFGYEPAASMNQMMKLSIADCVFTEQEVLVTINVPVRRITSDLKLLKLTRVPFVWKKQLCTLASSEEFLVADGEHHYSLPARSKSCDVSKGLCKVRKIGTGVSRFDRCAKIILNGGTVESIVKFCVLQCEANDGEPRVVDLGNNMVAIANSKQILQLCNKTSSIIQASEGAGCTVANISCHCSLLVDGMLTVPSMFPCGSDFNAVSQFETHLLPHWAKLNDTDLSVTADKLSKLLDSLDDTWEGSLPVIHVAPPAPLAEQGHLRFQMQNASLSNFWQTVWLVILSAFVAVLVLKLILEQMSVRMAAVSRSGPWYVSLLIPGVTAQDNKSNLSSFVWNTLREIEIGGLIITVLWIMFAIVAATVVIRILKAVRHITRVVDYLAKDDEEARPFPNENRRRTK